MVTKLNIIQNGKSASFDIEENSDGSFILASDYEALKAERDALERQISMSEAKCKGYFSDGAAALVRCDALAVENAALRGAITTHSQSTHFCELCGKDDPCSTDDVCYAINETPATDAALAAIEARGVEKFVTKVADRLRTAGGEDGYSLVHWGEYADHLEAKGEEFANELREAK